MIITANALDGLQTIPTGIVDACITSPPYFGLRDYGIDGQIGLEPMPDTYVEKLVSVFREVRRILRDDGTMWINIGDSYAGSGKGAWANKVEQKEVYVPDANSPQYKMLKTWSGVKNKDLIGIPWMLAFALRADGWYLRQDIIWHKPNPMPESVADRCTGAHEYIFLFSKSARYFFNSEAIKEPAVSTDNNSRDRERTRLNNVPGRTRMKGLTKNDYTTRNKRDVWTVSTRPYKETHFATFPPDLIRPCILAGSRLDGIVLDPFFGAGTTGLVACEEGRRFIGVDLNPEYCALAKKRIIDFCFGTGDKA